MIQRYKGRVASMLRATFVCMFLLMSCNRLYSQIYDIRVGGIEFIKLEAPIRNAIINQAAWGCNSNYVRLVNPGPYGASVEVTHYFEGSATITVFMQYYWYDNFDRMHVNAMEKQFLIRCVGYTATLNTTYLKLYVGQRYQLTVNMTNYGGFSPTWSSSNPSIAAVNSLGLVGANNVGTATITCDPIVGPKISCRVEVVMPDGGGSGGDDSGGGSGGDDTGGGDTGGDDTGGGEDNFEELYNSAVRRLGELRSESMEYIDNNRI